MPVFDAASYCGDLLGWKAELGVRIQDLLVRKAVPFTAKLGAIVGYVENAATTSSLKGALRDLFSFLRQKNVAASDGELEALFQQIIRHRAEESIENYSEYLFAVDVRL